MADEEEGTTMGDNPPIEIEQGPLVSVTFQRNPARKQKYLEAQPKALGITQIGLTIYQLSWMCVLLSDVSRLTVYARTPFIIASTVIMIAGSLAIGAKTLHIPTLRACLVMQIFAIIASVFNMILVLLQFENDVIHSCWFDWDHQNGTGAKLFLCRQMQHAYSHCYAGGMLVQTALVAISITLAAYCCKVINCCSPASKMPVITVQVPPNPSALE